MSVPVENGVRFSTGTGISYLTPVGAVRLSLAYKLNPSTLDVRDAGDVLNALLQDRPIESVEPDWSRRLHLHLLWRSLARNAVPGIRWSPRLISQGLP